MEKQADALWAMYVTILLIMVEKGLVTMPDLLNRLRLVRQGLWLKHGDSEATTLLDATMECFKRPGAEVVPMRKR